MQSGKAAKCWENAQKQQEYTSQIWTQINTYVKEYGQQNDYSYILGANGSGSIMYGLESQNITDVVIEFVNKKYEGE